MPDRKTIDDKGDDLRNLPPVMGTLVCKKGDNTHVVLGPSEQHQFLLF